MFIIKVFKMLNNWTCFIVMLYLLLIDAHQVWFQSSGEGCNQCCSYLQVEFLKHFLHFGCFWSQPSKLQQDEHLSADFIFHIKSYLLIVKQIALLCLLFFACWHSMTWRTFTNPISMARKARSDWFFCCKIGILYAWGGPRSIERGKKHGTSPKLTVFFQAS